MRVGTGVNEDVVFVEQPAACSAWAATPLVVLIAEVTAAPAAATAFVTAVSAGWLAAGSQESSGTSWTAVRGAAANRTLRGNDPGVRETVRRFGQLVLFAGMQLSQHLGVLVRTGVSRRDVDDPAARLRAQVAEFVDTGRLVGTLVVPEAFGPIEVVDDLRSNKISCALAVPTPRNRKTPRGQVTWLTGQLHDPPADLLLQAVPARARQPGPTCTVAAALEDPLVALDGTKVELRELRMSLIRSAGPKRGRGRGSFIESVVDLVGEFYECVVQELEPVAPIAPKVKARDATSEDAAPGMPGMTEGAIADQDVAGSDPDEEPIALEPDDVAPTSPASESSALPWSATELEHSFAPAKTVPVPTVTNGYAGHGVDSPPA